MAIARFTLAFAVASTLSVFAQPALKPATLTFTVIDGTVSDVLDAIERIAVIEIQVDDAVAAELNSRVLERVNFVDARLEDALRFLTSRNELFYEVVDEKTIRIRARQ